MTLKPYKPISDLRKQTFTLWYSFATYELLKSDSLRKGYTVTNIGSAPIVVWFGLELETLYPLYPVAYELVLNPGDWYLGDVPEIIPLAARWLKEADQFGLGSLTVTEFF